MQSVLSSSSFWFGRTCECVLFFWFGGSHFSLDLVVVASQKNCPHFIWRNCYHLLFEFTRNFSLLDHGLIQGFSSLLFSFDSPSMFYLLEWDFFEESKTAAAVCCCVHLEGYYWLRKNIQRPDLLRLAMLWIYQTESLTAQIMVWGQLQVLHSSLIVKHFFKAPCKKSARSNDLCTNSVQLASLFIKWFVLLIAGSLLCPKGLLSLFFVSSIR